MGLLGKFRKRVSSPVFLRMKRKRSEPLTLASTCDVTENETFDAIGASSSQKEEHIRGIPLNTKYEALEDEVELLSPDSQTHDRQLYSGEMKTCNIIEDEKTSEETPPADEKEDVDDECLHVEEANATEVEEKKPAEGPRYVSSSEDEEDPTSNEKARNAPKRSFLSRPLVEVTTDKSASGGQSMKDCLANLYARRKDDDESSDGSEAMSHIYNDELSTLYEVPTDREDNDSIVSSTSMTDLEEILGGLRVRRGQGNNSAEDGIIRARWDYALNMMCGNSALSFNRSKLAQIEKDDMCGPDMAEI